MGGGQPASCDPGQMNGWLSWVLHRLGGGGAAETRRGKSLCSNKRSVNTGCCVQIGPCDIFSTCAAFLNVTCSRGTRGTKNVREPQALLGDFLSTIFCNTSGKMTIIRASCFTRSSFSSTMSSKAFLNFYFKTAGGKGVSFHLKGSFNVKYF